MDKERKNLPGSKLFFRIKPPTTKLEFTIAQAKMGTKDPKEQVPVWNFIFANLRNLRMKS